MKNYNVEATDDRESQKTRLAHTEVTVYLQGWLQFRTDVAPLGTPQIPKTLHQIKAYRTGYSNISLPFQENKFPSFPHTRNLKVQIVVQEFQLNTIFIFWKFVFFP